MKILKGWRNLPFRRSIYFPLSVMFFLFITGFQRCDPPPPPVQKPLLVLVFCDITTSVDGQSIESVIEKARNLVVALPVNSRIVAFPIDNTNYPDKLLDYEIPECKKDNLTGTLKEKAEEKCRAQIPEKIKEFGENIKKKYEELKADTSIKQRSCIIDTLSKVNEFFKGENKDKYQFEVLYLSDMIEECTSSVGSIFLCSNSRKPVKESILKDVQDHYGPAFNLKDVMGNNVSFVITTKLLGDAQYKCLYPDEHKEVWQQVFSKVGYTKEDFASFPFTSEIPSKFKRREAVE